MSDAPKDEMSPSEPDPEALRESYELAERMRRKEGSISEELGELTKRLRQMGFSQKGKVPKLTPTPHWKWPKPEPFATDPPGSDAPLRNDPE